jgi:hypothetical protein
LLVKRILNVIKMHGTTIKKIIFIIETLLSVKYELRPKK